MSLRIYIYFIALSTLLSLIVYARGKQQPAYLKLFPPYLFLTLLAEVWGTYLWSVGKSNVALYNIFSTFEFCFYFWAISEMISNKKVKRAILFTIPAYCLIVTYNLMYGQKMIMFHTVTYSLGCLLIVICCIYYFFELFRVPKSLKLSRDPSFWICSGLLFFYCCGFPLYGLINFLFDISFLLLKNFDKVVTILNIFLYTLFSIGFLCIKTRKYTLSRS